MPANQPNLPNIAIAEFMRLLTLSVGSMTVTFSIIGVLLWGSPRKIPQTIILRIAVQMPTLLVRLRFPNEGEKACAVYVDLWPVIIPIEKDVQVRIVFLANRSKDFSLGSTNRADVSLI